MILGRLMPAVALALVALALVALALVAASSPVEHGGDSGGQAPPAASAGLAATSAAGPCLILEHRRDMVVDGQSFGPCGTYGIVIAASERITIRNVVVRDTGDIGIYILGSKAITVEQSRVSNGLSGIFAQSSEGVRVHCNRLDDMRGPIPRGQFVQFNRVQGAGNVISCNRGQNRPGTGDPEDAISLYISNGVPGAPIRVERNLIIGGGPSDSGGGIMLGDDGGSHLLAERNVLIDPGQYGIAVASGRYMTIADNLIYARRQPFTNVGITVWNQYPSACGNITIRGNQVNWTSRDGTPNPYWDAGNCGAVTGIAQNSFSAPLGPEIEARALPDCGCKAFD
ncbi:parallel beta helix pectate lyase-like protein [Humitalea rosea]|uniref:Parallel beta helix pectate lyase-like protein n=1 Tax=Humitalea rosea TaxID=990373 RepID=A0A2W7HVB2_9PROT|nr:right-handed parallel beta-helix repeat-containing protein [Humitalea rosea]PZW38681.1 parallel beta helix pectate lyase-like protein [Humitalea rosea]